MSIALLGANIKVKGDFVIQKGEYKGKGIITSAIKLLKWLSSDSVFGKADIVINSPSCFNDVYSKLKEKKESTFLSLIIIDGQADMQPCGIMEMR